MVDPSLDAIPVSFDLVTVLPEPCRKSMRAGCPRESTSEITPLLLVECQDARRCRRLGAVPDDRVETRIGEHAHLATVAGDPHHEVVRAVHDGARGGARLARGIGAPAVGGAAGSEHERQREEGGTHGQKLVSRTRQE
jgi:hypothetical protein